MRTDGAAMIEAVIALPILILALVAAIYFHALATGLQSVAAEAQRKAWHAAGAGCRASEAQSTRHQQGESPDELDRVIARAEQAGGSAPGGFAGLQGVPGLGRAFSLAPRSVHASATFSLPAPRALRLHGNDATATALVACNEEPKTAKSIGRALFHAWIGDRFR